MTNGLITGDLEEAIEGSGWEVTMTGSVGFDIGAQYTMDLNPNLKLEPTALLSTKNYSWEIEDSFGGNADFDFSFTSLEVQIPLVYTLQSGLFFEGGLGISQILSTGGDIDDNPEWLFLDEDEISATQISAIFGIGYSINDQIAARAIFSQGFTKLYDDNDLESVKLRGLSLSLTYWLE